MCLDLTGYLKKQHLVTKIIGLFFLAIILFGAVFLIKKMAFLIFFYCFFSFVLLLTCLGFCVLDKQTFVAMLKVWLLGVFIYLLIAIPRIYLADNLSPYFHLHGLLNRWLYTALLPLILLGTFSVGLVFMRVTSPVEFLCFGRFGLKMVLLFRVLEHTGQIFQETKTAFIMQGLWPEGGSSIFSLHKSWLIIKNSPALVRMIFYSIILHWFPWGWLYFNRLEQRVFHKVGDTYKDNFGSRKT